MVLEITRQNGKLYQYDENAPRPYFTFYVILIIFQKQLWKKWNTVKFEMLLVSSTTQPSSFISKKGEVEWTEPNSSGGPKYLHIDAQKWKKNRYGSRKFFCLNNAIFCDYFQFLEGSILGPIAPHADALSTRPQKRSPYCKKYLRIFKM